MGFKQLIAFGRIRSARMRGFTMVEMAIVITMTGILTAMIGQRVAPLLSRSGAGHAAAVIALDLEHAVSLAGRQRMPVRVIGDSTTQSYTLTDRASGTVLFRRVLGGVNGGYGVTRLAFSTTPLDVFPSGLTSGALTVTVSAGTVSRSRQVTMSTGGFVRVIR